jgi:hypothetical protein
MEANRDQVEAAESVTLKRALGVDAVQHAEEITSWNKRAEQNAGVWREARDSSSDVADRC